MDLEGLDKKLQGFLKMEYHDGGTGDFGRVDRDQGRSLLGVFFGGLPWFTLGTLPCSCFTIFLIWAVMEPHLSIAITVFIITLIFLVLVIIAMPVVELLLLFVRMITPIFFYNLLPIVVLLFSSCCLHISTS